MANKRLKAIQQRCDTSGTRLSEEEKGLLSKIIDNQDKYNGFKSPVYIENNSGRDYNDTWRSTTKTQYEIHVDDNNLSVDEHHEHTCDDGYEHKADWSFFKVRDILRALKNMKSDL